MATLPEPRQGLCQQPCLEAALARVTEDLKRFEARLRSRRQALGRRDASTP
jgi:hypothetical protein